MAYDPAEQVLCTHRADLPSFWLAGRGATRLDWAGLGRSLRQVPPAWRPRGEVETDGRLKQWIPYALLRRADGRLALYQRAGAETRLHGRWSLGVGGHVVEADAGTGVAWSWRRTLRRGLLREVAEELDGISRARPRCLGVVNEEKTAVGRVHLGLVCLLDVRTTACVAPREELPGLEWLPPEALAGRDLETWSALALELV